MIAYQLFDHVQDRVGAWVDPWSVSRDHRVPDRAVDVRAGIGRVRRHRARAREPAEDPERVDRLRASPRSARSSACSARSSVCILFLLFVGSGFRIAVQADRPFSKLFAAGLTTIIGVQTFVIVGGVIRVIPLTGVTLPVHLVRRLVARRQLRDRRACCCASPTRRSRSAEAPRRGRDRNDRRRVGCARGSRPERTVNRADPARRLRGDGADPPPGGAAHLPPGGRREPPRQRPEQRAQAARRLSTAPVARSSPPTAQIVAQLGAEHRRQRLQLPARVPARARCSRTISGYQSFVNVGNTGVEESYDRVLTGRGQELDLDNIGDVLSGKQDTQQRGALAAPRSPAARGRPARGPEGLDRRARREDRCGAGDVLEPDVRPQRRSPVTTPRRSTCVLPLQRRPGEARCSRARTASCYPPGSTFKIVTAVAAIDAGHRHARPSRCSRSAAASPPADEHPLQNFGGGTVRRQPHRERSCVRATRRSQSSATARRRLRAAAWRAAAVEAGTRPPLDLDPDRGRQRRAPPGSFENDKPSFARAGDRPGRVAPRRSRWRSSRPASATAA